MSPSFDTYRENPAKRPRWRCSKMITNMNFWYYTLNWRMQFRSVHNWNGGLNLIYACIKFCKTLFTFHFQYRLVVLFMSSFLINGRGIKNAMFKCTNVIKYFTYNKLRSSVIPYRNWKAKQHSSSKSTRVFFLYYMPYHVFIFHMLYIFLGMDLQKRILANEDTTLLWVFLGCLFLEVLRPTHGFFTHMEISPLPAANFDLYRAFMAIELWEFFCVPDIL